MEELPRRLPPELEVLKPVVRGLAATLGSWCELSIHDFSNPEQSLVAIAGEVTGRRVGAPLTDRLLQLYRTHGDAVPDVLNLRTRRDGRLIKTSTIFIRNRQGKVVGSLGINLNVTELDLAAQLLTQVIGTVAGQPEESIDFATDVAEVMSHLLESALQQAPRPPQLMSREEKVQLVRLLDGKGLFLIKGAVEEVAARLGVSRFTIYTYLDEGRKQEDAG